MFKGEIIAVGTELLLGQIANTNARYISEKMAQNGIPIYFHVTVGDNSERISKAINEARKRSNLIIFTGGLGPTEDDLTKETLAKVLDKDLILDDYSFDRIINFFKQRNTFMTDNNKKQAMVLKGSKVFQNDIGLAAGIGLIDDDITYILLPGPPSEMKPMLDNYVIPWLKAHSPVNPFYSKIMRFAGLGEAALEEKIIDLIQNQINPTIAPLASEGEVKIRLTANGEVEAEALALIAPVEQEIHNRLEAYHYGYGDEELERVVVGLLNRLGLTISVTESCTGGLVGSQFTSIPGSSKVYHGGIICYDNSIKNHLLGVPENVLEHEGAVSIEAARILAENTLNLFNTDLALSITGIAGPNTVEGKPIGLVYIGISEKGKETIVKERHLSGDRKYIQTRTAKYVFYYLWKSLKERLKTEQ